MVREAAAPVENEVLDSSSSTFFKKLTSSSGIITGEVVVVAVGDVGKVVGGRVGEADMESAAATGTSATGGSAAAALP